LNAFPAPVAWDRTAVAEPEASRNHGYDDALVVIAEPLAADFSWVHSDRAQISPGLMGGSVRTSGVR
jgi:hypothetical protein